MSSMFREKDLKEETMYECDHYYFEQLEGDGSWGFFYDNEYFYG